MSSQVKNYVVFKIKSEQAAYFESAFSLLNRILGEGLYTRGALQDVADSEDSTVLGCLIDGRVAAAAMFAKKLWAQSITS